MTKQSGLGDGLWFGGYDLSGDIGSLGTISGRMTPLDVTAIDKEAPEREGGSRDGLIEYTSWFNPTAGQAHPVLSVMPTTDVQVTYRRGGSLGSPAASIISKQPKYDGSRSQDGAFSFALSAVSNRYGLEWGLLHTAGIRTDTEATSPATGVDGGAATSFGLQAYLHVFAFTGTDATITIQESSAVDGGGDAFADVVGGGFTQILAAGFVPQTERIYTARDLAVEQYLRVITTTTGGITSLSFAVNIVRNQTAVVF